MPLLCGRGRLAPCGLARTRSRASDGCRGPAIAASTARAPGCCARWGEDRSRAAPGAGGTARFPVLGCNGGGGRAPQAGRRANFQSGQVVGLGGEAMSEKLWFLNTLVSVQVPHELGPDGVSVLESRAPHGDSPPLHVHGEDEIFHVLEGTMLIRVGGEDRVVLAGESLLA